MKIKASSFLKQVISVLTSLVKAKSMAVKSKASAIKTRLIIFSLLSNKSFLLGSISHKIHTLLGRQDKRDGRDAGHHANANANANAAVQYNAMTNESHSTPTLTELVDDIESDDYNGELVEDIESDDHTGPSNSYPDVTQPLVDEEDLKFADSGGSIIDLVRSSNGDDKNFRLEDKIDEAADLFIRWFHREMRMQKQDSFKSYQDMLARSA